MKHFCSTPAFACRPFPGLAWPAHLAGPISMIWLGSSGPVDRPIGPAESAGLIWPAPVGPPGPLPLILGLCLRLCLSFPIHVSLCDSHSYSCMWRLQQRLAITCESNIKALRNSSLSPALLWFWPLGSDLPALVFLPIKHFR